MDDYVIRSGNVGETAAKPSVGDAAPGGNRVISSLGGLAATFTELLQKMGSRIEGRSAGLSAQAEMAAAERADDPLPIADRRPERAEERPAQRADAGEPRDEPRDLSADNHRAEGDDRRPRDRESFADNRADDRRIDPKDGQADDHRASTTDHGNSANAATADKSEADEANAAAGPGDSAVSKSAAKGKEAATHRQADSAAHSARKQAGAGTVALQQAQQVLAALSVPTQAIEATLATGPQKAGEAIDPDAAAATANGAAELAQAAAKKTGDGTAAQHRSAHGAPGQAAAAAVETGQGKTQGETLSQGRSDNGAFTGDNRGAADAALKALDGAAKQAADLSRLVGEGNRMSVQVEVSDASATLVSKPGASLAPSALVANDPAAPSQHGQSAVQANGAAFSVQASGSTGQTVSGQASAQAPGQLGNQQATQIQAAASDTKGAAQAGVHNGQAASAPQAAEAGNAGAAGQATPNNHTQEAGRAQAAQQVQRPQVHNQAFVDQVSVHITKAIKDGVDKINIQLRPASLGRIDVQLEVGQDGRISAVVTADNRQTLDLLQRDARGLERALQDAGLQADSGSMSFNLREQNDGRPESNHGMASGRGREAEPEPVADRLEAILSSELQGGVRADGRIDIRI